MRSVVTACRFLVLCVFVGYGVSVEAVGAGSAAVRVSGSTVTGNQIGLVQYYPSGPSSSLLSRDDNTVEGNTTNTFGTIGSYAAK